jgi:AraC-like DNA-binding protein
MKSSQQATPAMADVLADVLERTRLGSAIAARMILRTPWGLKFPAARRAGFHAVLRGACTLEVQGEPTRILHQGDIVMLPHGSQHVLVSQPKGALTTVPELAARARRGIRDGILEGGGSGPEAEIVCGLYLFESEATHPVLAHLPKVVHVGGGAMARPDIEAAMRLLALELSGGSAGSRTVITRLADVLFVLVVRTFMATEGATRVGWLAALGDASIGRALSRMHGNIARRPPLDELAKIAGISRATFNRRFLALVGQSPRAYMVELSLQEAGRLLARTDMSLAEVARKTGYENEYSFSKAFRRVKGTSPGRYRARVRSVAPGGFEAEAAGAHDRGVREKG